VLNVLGFLVELEPVQAKLLEKVCMGPLISSEDLRLSDALELPPKVKKSKKKPTGPLLFDSHKKLQG
jgi:hypothetical protein